MVANALSKQGKKGQFDSVDALLNKVELVDSNASQVSEMVLCDHSDFSLFCLDSHSGLFLISFPHPTWLEELKSSYLTDAKVLGILQTLHTNLDAASKFNCRMDSCCTKARFTCALIVV